MNGFASFILFITLFLFPFPLIFFLFFLETFRIQFLREEYNAAIWSSFVLNPYSCLAHHAQKEPTFLASWL
jgi:hypothetical protein